MCPSVSLCLVCSCVLCVIESPVSLSVCLFDTFLHLPVCGQCRWLYRAVQMAIQGSADGYTGLAVQMAILG